MKFAVAAFFFAIFIAIFIGIHETPDSFFYMNLGQYLWTGQHVPVRPWNITSPQTLFGPLYPILASPTISLPPPWSQFLLPTFQLILLISSTFLVWKMLNSLLTHPWPLVGAVIFILLPFNVIYATLIMSETLTQFLLILFLSSRQRGARVLIAALLTLARYAYGLLLVISLFLWIRKITKASMLPAGLGIIAIFAWMFFNYRHFGVWTLSMVTGRHIYNNVVTQGKFLPSVDNPLRQEFQKVFPDESIFFRPWWSNQFYFQFYFQPTISERQVDQLYLNLSLAAIKEHPVGYALHLLRMPLQVLVTAPFTPIHTFVVEADCRQDPPCRAPWNRNLCRPVFNSCLARRSWFWATELTKQLHQFIAIIWLILGSIGVIIAVKSRQKILRSAVAIFLVMLFAQAWTEWAEGRFVIPLYGPYAILITVGMNTLYERIRARI